MLTVAKVTQAGASGYADYLEGRSQAGELGDYYVKDGERVEAPGRWAAGAGAVGCDPDAPVGGGQLRALMAVRRPHTGAPLRQTGGSGEAVAALDATFSAPKSVSAVWALADRELRSEIERAHERAIDQALGYSLDRVAMIRQRLDADTVIHGKAAGLVATSWRHTTARAVPDQMPDPQLHSHVLLHGAVRRDGKVLAIDSRAWLVHRRELGAAYRTELARRLHTLGFQIQRGTGHGGRYFELDGVPAGLIDRWSSRHHQVHAAIHARLATQRQALEDAIDAGGSDGAVAAERLELLDTYGQLSPAHERLMATATRSRKAPVTVGDLDRYWQNTAGEHDLDRSSLDRLRGPASRPAAASQEELMHGLTEFDATFPARDARAVALERSAGVPIPAAVEQLRELRTSQDLVLLADRTFTTREHRQLETATVTVAGRVAEENLPPLAQSIVTAQTDRLDQDLAQQGGRLSHEQRQAIELACGTRQVVVIEGHAGTGKSTTLTGIARAHQATGRQLIITSTAGLAAQRLAAELAQAGVETSSYSTAALASAVISSRVELGPDVTIIHDEAALASTREQHQLLTMIEASGARLIQVGDPQQNQPVGASGLWPHLRTIAHNNSAHVELTRNQRARDPADRRDQAYFRAERHELAIRGYAARGRIHITHQPTVAEDAALDAAQADRAAGKRTIVICQTSNDHLDQFNARAQAIRHQHGELGADSIPVAGRPYRLHPGDNIQMRRSISHSHGQLRNGTTARIEDVDPRTGALHLRLNNQDQIDLDAAQAARADLRLAYVQHPFPAQGQTTETAHLIVGEQATRHGTYVAITRARDQTHIYTPQPDTPSPDSDRLTVLAAQLSRTEPDLPSIDTPLAHELTMSRSPDANDPNSENPQATHPRSLEHQHIREPAHSKPEFGTDHVHEIRQHNEILGDTTHIPAPDRNDTAAVSHPAAHKLHADTHRETRSRRWPEPAYDDSPTPVFANHHRQLLENHDFET